MIKATYPLIDTKDFVEISIGQPERDPKSSHEDRRCACKISGPTYEKIFYAHGIDEIQCVWIGLRQIRVEIAEFEKKTNMKCEYRYFQDFEE
ncbi:MAG: hypothetical protein UV42_C0050G0018 [Candidatus Magasanikbacteria bacterium GW2011_GWE2_42_7]|uniref:DUF6968 domain-containing protein n=1 Tax=Candidatus Magasanikbacteria bacterium GW2011_GWE2_42_7 TaxID=1619052 RepID=A0A0G1DIB2_9BACT|nr:MAG: hypothetical protein UV42_C0050G0018 [Candidatus Magasanikbacteria bacterium GW2011_GWE2_42_7]